MEDQLSSGNVTLTVDDVVQVKQHFGLSRQATLVRLQNEGYLTRQSANTMKKDIIPSAKRLGFEPALYLPTPLNKQHATYGKYVALAETLRERGLVSTGNYEELLLDGFRGEMVFGTSQEKERYD